MALMPYSVFHFLFGLSFVLSYFEKLFISWLFGLYEWDLYKQGLLLFVLLCLTVHCISHIFCNLMMFAGHGDPISFGQKDKLFPLRMKCENEKICNQNMYGNIRREGKLVKYEYDAKLHYHGPADESDIIPNATTVVFFHANGIPACEHSFFPQYLMANFRNINVCLFEYPGYGRRGSENASIYQLDSVRDEIAETWNAISTKFKSTNMIAAGLSLGGGFCWSSVDRLDPAPKRMILMNTFADLSAFLKEESRIYYPALSILAPSPISNYRISKKSQSKWKGEVVVVHAIGDEFFPPTHEMIFNNHFKDDIQYKYKAITLPAPDSNYSMQGGGMWHNDSIFVPENVPKWIACFKLDS